MRLVISILIFSLMLSLKLHSQEYEVAPDVESCKPGVLKDETLQQVIDRVNFIRSLHKLSPIEYDHNGSQMSMEGCLNIVASGEGGHIDDPNSECYTQGAGEARMKSNLFQAWASNPINYTSVSSIDGWMIDNNTSNPEKVGHRRAIINPFLKKFSFGKAEGYSKDGSIYMVAMNFLYQDYVTGAAEDDVDFIAYPFENYPTELVDKSFYLSFSTIYNRSGAFANGDVDYSNAEITVIDENEQEMQVNDVQYDLEGWGSLPNNIVFKVSGLQNEVKYDVTINNVVFNGQSNDYSYWFRLTDVISEEPPAIPVLLTPEDEKTDASVTQAFSWEKSQFASSYQIQIATDNIFENMFDEAENYTSTSYAASGSFEYETQYFWRVRAKNQNGESDWSDTRTFTTGKPTPGSIALLEPADGADGLSLTPTLLWQSDPVATSYEVEFWKNEDMVGWSLFNEKDIPDTTYTVDESKDLNTETEYFWRVRAVNNSGNGQWTELYSFTTGDGASVFADNSQINLKISPNPFSDECFITFNNKNAERVFFDIYNLSGTRVYSRNIGYTGAGENTILYNANVESGMYIIRLKIGNSTYQDRIIISR